MLQFIDDEQFDLGLTQVVVDQSSEIRFSALRGTAHGNQYQLHQSLEVRDSIERDGATDFLLGSYFEGFHVGGKEAAFDCFLGDYVLQIHSDRRAFATASRSENGRESLRLERRSPFPLPKIG